jgi:hypothetical protein
MMENKLFLGYTAQNTLGEFLLGPKPDVWGNPLEIKHIFVSLEKIQKALLHAGKQAIYRVYRINNLLEVELHQAALSAPQTPEQTPAANLFMQFFA